MADFKHLIKRILTFNEAVTSKPIQIVDLDDIDVTKDYKYSWSTDGLCWTDWAEYDQYLDITKNLETDFYLRILILGSIKKVLFNKQKTKAYSLCIAKTNLDSECNCDNPNLFQPYQNLDCAMQLNQYLSDIVCCMFGIPIYYFRVDPDKGSADYTFKEFSLHNVVACKQLKLMVEDGQMPSSNPQLQELDFAWEADWETEISKSAFATAFGDTVIPKQRDIIYIPLMKRMWQVNAAYDEKQEGFMWRSATWKIKLVKYQNSTNIDQQDFESIIDNFVGKTWENTFQDKENNEQNRESGHAQVKAPFYAANNLMDIFMQDAVRQAYTKDDIKILDNQICHHSNIVSRNQYQFLNENGCIIYQKGICGESGILSFIITTPSDPKGSINKDILKFGPIKFEYAFDGNRQLIGIEDMYSYLAPMSTYLCIYKWNRNTYTKELSIYKHIHRTDMPVYLIKPVSYWFDLDNPVLAKIDTYNNDYILDSSQKCTIYGYPLVMTNIKLYNIYMNKEDSIKECLKYTVDDKHCIINDLARQINAGRGYSIR